MTHKINPILFRLGHTTTWRSRWFNQKNFQQYLKEDVGVRDIIEKKLKHTGIKTVEIERTGNSINIIIYAAKTGLIIGRGGEGVAKVKSDIEKFLRQCNLQRKMNYEVKISIEEIKSPESHAPIVAQNIADQLEKRMPFKRAIKQAVDKASANKEVEGVKVSISGRLGGAEIARTESAKEGRIPLQTLRGNVDYSYKTALTNYGIIGIKVWIYKGELFENQQSNQK